MELAFDRTRPLAAIVVGRAGMDLYPLPDGVETEAAEGFAAEIGGSAGNIAVAIAQQEQPAALLGALSDDAVGRFVRKHLNRYAVDTSRCLAVPGTYRTSLALCETRPEDSETVFYRNGAADLQLRGDVVDASFIGSASFLVVTGTAFAAEPSRSATLQALRLARTEQTFSILDIDYRAVSWNSRDETVRVLAQAARLCDSLVGNDEELALLAGDRDGGLSAATAFIANGGDFAVLKRGDAGSITFTTTESFETEIFAVEAMKPFGAGDAFLGTLVVGLRRGLTLQQSVHRATAAAAYVVARRGCAFAMPTPAQLDAFIQGYAGT